MRRPARGEEEQSVRVVTLKEVEFVRPERRDERFAILFGPRTKHYSSYVGTAWQEAREDWRLVARGFGKIVPIDEKYVPDRFRENIAQVETLRRDLPKNWEKALWRQPGFGFALTPHGLRAPARAFRALRDVIDQREACYVRDYRLPGSVEIAACPALADFPGLIPVLPQVETNKWGAYRWGEVCLYCPAERKTFTPEQFISKTGAGRQLMLVEAVIDEGILEG
jgi:hypothetical protein